MRHTVLRWHLDLQRERSPVLRYGLSVVCVAVALGLALALQHYPFQGAELPLFGLSIGLVTWYEGIGPSALAVVLSTASFNYFFTEPFYTFDVSPQTCHISSFS